MRIGGSLSNGHQKLSAWLHSASRGSTPCHHSRWWPSRWQHWVLDLNGSDQLQKVNSGPPFLRKAGTLALYRPEVPFEEWQEASHTMTESWLLFSATDEVAESLTNLLTPEGYQHFEDLSRRIEGKMVIACDALFQRKHGFQWLAQGEFLSILSLLISSFPSQHSGAGRLIPSPVEPARYGLKAIIEDFVLRHLDEPLQVADLAAYAGMSLSSFAHRYRADAGEAPYQTIVRLKMSAAKQMLLNGETRVKEIAARLGFSSEYQFSRSFKRSEGLSPRHYTRSLNMKQ